MASEYPTKIDPELPELANKYDMVTDDVIGHVADMLKAVQTGLGLRPADIFPSDGGADFGSIAAAIFHLNRVKSGHYGPTTINDEDELNAVEVSLPDRFRVTPFVKLQAQQPVTGGLVSALFSRNVSVDSFQIAAFKSSLMTTFPLTLEFDWVAIEPPFGREGED